MANPNFFVLLMIDTFMQYYYSCLRYTQLYIVNIFNFSSLFNIRIGLNFLMMIHIILLQKLNILTKSEMKFGKRLNMLDVEDNNS